MDPFSYLAVLISIILGFGITQLLSAVGRLLQHRKRVLIYWPSIEWAGLLLVLHVQTWWAMFGLRTYQHWSFVAFLLVLLQPIILYLLAALVLPDVSLADAGDLRTNYYDHSRWFFGLSVALLVASLTRDRVLAGHLPGTLNLAAHIVLLVGWGIGALTQREWYHRLLAPCTALLMVAYIAVLFGTLA